MQHTVASLAGRLDMTAEAAVEALRYMMFEIEGVDSVLTDEQCDLLIDVDGAPSVAEAHRQKVLAENDKAQKRTERLKEAARKAAAKRKTEATAKKAEEAKKAAAKKKPRARKGAAKAAEGEEAEGAVLAPETPEGAARVAAHALAEILPAEPAEGAPQVETAGEAVSVAVPKPEAVAAKAAPTVKPPKPKKKREAGPAIIIGSAIEHDKPTIHVVRADGTQVEAPEVEILPEEHPLAVAPPEPEEEEGGLLAEAERRQEEEEKRKAKLAARSTVRPDPAVVAEVIRRAAERKQKLKMQHPEGPSRKTGKTARKKQKKVEKMRAEEDMRRSAAATVREFQTAGPTGLIPRRRKRKRTREEDAAMAEAVDSILESNYIEVEDGITVEDLAEQMEVGVNDLILNLMDLNVLATKNQVLSLDLVRRIAEPKGFEVHTVIPEEAEVLEDGPDDPADVVTRAPVITVMGHVDHGKTTLLDRVRAANVAAGEAGGITQHIAAYDARIGEGRVVFLDTPGHEAFTQMRARGAQATDVVVLVVAADDGVMPQTVEAIDHARAANVPIVVAINKCDKPNAQPDRIRQELMKYELVDEQWGGKTVIKNISAKNGEGVHELMELLALEAELLELKANPKKRARGVVIESEISRGQGPVAWVLVQTGTLHVGDTFLAGQSYGRVRSMISSRGEVVAEAGPATPVLVVGFSSAPDAGDAFVVLQDERVARSIAEKRAIVTRQRQGQVVRHVSLEDFHARILAGEKHHLHVVLKADVQGSVDVLESSLAKVGNEEVHVQMVHAGVGGINESDVLLASASDAVIIGFHVTANARVQKLAEQEGVDIRTYLVIYDLVDNVRRALEGMLAPETREVVSGHAEIRQVFRSSALGNIAGCFVQDGEITRGGSVRLVRDDVVVYTGKINSLRREKDDARAVAAGFECGIKIENFEDIKAGDIIESFQVESIAKTLT